MTIQNRKVSFKSEKFPETEAEVVFKSREEYIAMTENEYQELCGVEKKKAALYRYHHRNREEGKVANPGGKNQHTEEKKIKQAIRDNQLAALKHLNSIVELPVVTLASIINNPEETSLNKIRASEVIMAYSISKPGTRKEETVEDKHKTFIVVPAEEKLPKKIAKVTRMRNPEKK